MATTPSEAGERDPEEPDEADVPEDQPVQADRAARRRAQRGFFRRLWPPTSFGLFSVGFLFLLASAGAIAVGQFAASPRAPWVSMGLSGAAVIMTAAALFRRRNP